MSLTTDWLQVGLLGLNAGLVYKYLRATQGILQTNKAQVEASFKPAIAVKMLGPGTHDNPALVNVGNGTAIEVQCALLNSEFTKTVPYIEAHAPHTPACELTIAGLRGLTTAAMAGGTDPIIECSYRSISGKSYRSTSTFNLDRLQFRTVFSERE